MKQEYTLTEGPLMEINLKHPSKKLGKNDQTAGVQVDRPAFQITVNKGHIEFYFQRHFSFKKKKIETEKLV